MHFFAISAIRHRRHRVLRRRLEEKREARRYRRPRRGRVVWVRSEHSAIEPDRHPRYLSLRDEGGDRDVFVIDGAAGVDEGKLGVLLKMLEDAFGELGFEEVVVGEAEEEFALGLAHEERTMLRGGDGGVVPKGADATVGVAGDDGGSVVSGAVVGDEDFDFGRGLGERAFNGAGEQVGAIHRGNGDG